MIFIFLPLSGMAAFTSGPTTQWEQIIEFFYLLQLPLIVLIICLQQYKGYRRLGYLMIVFILYSYFYGESFKMFREFLLDIPSIIEDPLFFSLVIIFILPDLIPVYVLAKTGYEDLFKKGKSKK